LVHASKIAAIVEKGTYFSTISSATAIGGAAVRWDLSKGLTDSTTRRAVGVSRRVLQIEIGDE
jgi:hypothetical protein